MAKHQANGFEIDDENPMIPLKSYLKVMSIFEHHDPKAWVTMNEELQELGVPMHILANVDQELSGYFNSQEVPHE